ncbi:MAG: DUF4091 domain-containing protein [Candidatus Glassbacteria bacterium]|nr:DUF4091 domain-containing protein [Candidatus Glassbacteria bacterium]
MRTQFFLLLPALAVATVTLHAGVRVIPQPAEAKVTRIQTEIDSRSHVFDPSSGVITVAGAGGESVFFQVVVQVVDDTLEGVTAKLGELTGPGGTVADSRTIEFLCPLVKVYAPSTEAGRAGWYPDPLVLLDKPVHIEPYRWQNTYNQTFWFEIAIPRGLAAGTYGGRVSVSDSEGELAAFPLKLKVHGFDLPARQHQYAMFNCSRSWLGSYYDEDNLGGVSLDDMLAKYFDFMLERGIQPWFNPLIQPEYEDKGDRLELSWPNLHWEKHFLAQEAYRRVTFPALPREMERSLGEEEKFTPEFKRKVRDWVGGIWEHYKQNGWQSKVSFFAPVDEPNTLDEYKELIRWGRLIKEVDPEINFQVTEQPLPSRPEWPSLAQVANDWVVHGKSLESNREELIRVTGMGQKAVWYISCDQTWPMANYFIDEPGIDPRAVAWITYRYRLAGMLYWAVNFWPEVVSPWRDAVTWKRSECNAPLAGEGSLVYPGEEIARFCGQSNVAGPVSSIRFEQLRKGMQDVEYLYLLKELGMDDEAEKLCMDLVISADTFSRDPQRYEQAKARAAELIERAK